MVKQQKERIQDTLPLLEEMVDCIVTQKIKEPGNIEPYLDTLKQCAEFGEGKDVYYKLLNYYTSINPKNVKYFKLDEK